MSAVEVGHACLILVADTVPSRAISAAESYEPFSRVAKTRDAILLLLYAVSLCRCAYACVRFVSQ